LAIDTYVYRLRKYIGSYAAALGRLDALVFTGGIGENAAGIRSAACRDLDLLGIVIDEDKNRAASREARAIHNADSRVRILVIPTNEELEIADQTKRLLESASGHETEDR
jgi:acetate kinase